jgi:hypothetical protein
MVDASTLRIEWQNGSCESSPSFVSPYQYAR